MNQKQKTRFKNLLSAKTLGILTSAAVLSSCSSISSQQQNVELEVKKYTLDNGLRVLIAPNPRLPIVSYYTLIDVGGKDEYAGTTGATHFLEHMMFKGAKKFGPGEFDTLLEKNGGSTNAFTSNDMTVYYETFPKDFLDVVIDMEADRMQNLLLEEKSFESERQVVLEERKMRYENSPGGLLWLESMKKIFAGTPYGQSVIGEVEDVTALSRDKMMEFFHTYYVPNNAIIAIAGDVNPSDVIKKMNEHFGPIKKSEALTEKKNKIDTKAVFANRAQLNKEYHFYATSETPKFMINFKGVPLTDKRMYALDLLANMLGDGSSSYLEQTYVRVDKPTFNNVYLTNYNLQYAGMLAFGGELAPGVKIETAKNTLLKDINNMCTNALTDYTLQKAKNQVLANSYNELMSNSGVALMLVSNEKAFNDYKYSFKDVERYNQVSLEEVKSVCRDFLKADESIYVTVWNKNPKTGDKK